MHGTILIRSSFGYVHRHPAQKAGDYIRLRNLYVRSTRSYANGAKKKQWSSCKDLALIERLSRMTEESTKVLEEHTAPETPNASLPSTDSLPQLLSAERPAGLRRSSRPSTLSFGDGTLVYVLLLMAFGRCMWVSCRLRRHPPTRPGSKYDRHSRRN